MNENIKVRNGSFKFGHFCLCPSERILYRDDQPVPVSSRGLDILIALVEKAGEVVPRRELIARAWPDMVVEEANLRVNVAGLRKVLGDGEQGVRYISNIPGRGYCFVSPVVSDDEAAPHPQTHDIAVANLPIGLPPPLSRMIGRCDTVDALRDMLKAHRFVSIVGPGGMGKTTVAISVAHVALPDFDNDVFFIDLGTINDASMVPVTIATSLGLIVQPQNCLASLSAHVANKKILLVIDNCEHVINMVAVLSERFFREAPNVHILATSRESLRVEGEHVFLLRSLNCPDKNAELTLENALKWPAVELFMERAIASGYGPVVYAEDVSIIGAICRYLDGIPLALELVAGRVAAYGIRGTADLLNQRFKLLWQGKRTALPRHQTLHAMLDWSFGLLSEIDRLVLCRLSVFSGVFTLEAAQSVASCPKVDASTVVESLKSLSDKSLLWCSTVDGQTYHRLLETTKGYAVEKLAECEDVSTVALRHAQFYLEKLKPVSQDVLPLSKFDFSRYAPHLGNIQAALEWSFSENGSPTIGVELAAYAAPVFLNASLLKECQHWCELGLSSMDDLTRETKLELSMQEALAISMMYSHGNSCDVQRALERGLRLSEALGETHHQINLMIGLNVFMTRSGRFSESVDIALKSYQVAKAAKSSAAMIVSDWMLSRSYHLIGDQEASRRHAEAGFKRASVEGLEHIDTFGYDHRVWALVSFSRTLWLQGFPEQAMQMARDSVDEAEKRHHPVNLCVAHIYASTVFLWSGSYAEAERHIERLLVHSTKHSLLPYHTVGQALKGELAILRGQSAIGVNLLRSALSILHKESHHVLTTGFSRALAEGLVECGRTEEALYIIDDTLSSAIAPEMTFDMAELLRVRGDILLRADKYLEAEESLLKAWSFTKAHHSPSFELRAAISLARLWLSKGHCFIAKAILAKALQSFTEGYDTLDLQIAKKLLEQDARIFADVTIAKQLTVQSS